MKNIIFTMSLMVEGSSGKGLEFIMPLVSIYNKNFCFLMNKDVLLKTELRIKGFTIFNITLLQINCSVNLFITDLKVRIFVLHNDAEKFTMVVSLVREY
jgi:hypothetical protein